MSFDQNVVFGKAAIARITFYRTRAASQAQTGRAMPALPER